MRKRKRGKIMGFGTILDFLFICVYFVFRNSFICDLICKIL